MSASRVIRHAIDPVIEVLRPLPPLAFIPLFIIWLGIGEMPKEVLIVIGVVPIMAVTTVAALDEVPEDLIMQAGDYLNTALVFSGIIMIAILGLALDACLRGLLLLADPSRRR
jgi:ABC-type nitrate/sulfonate/bicarbonate transport system permease component